jgi:acylphosphatase
MRRRGGGGRETQDGGATVERVRLVFEGRVQGVLFRANTQRIARDLGLTGWVRNLEDGRVEAVVEGSREAVKQLIGRLQREVRAAKVKKVKQEWSEGAKEFSAFEVRGDF